jgi:hypothetical protein
MTNAWEREPDMDAWEHAGLKCYARRHPQLRAWCGYVAVPEGHPLHGRTVIEACCAEPEIQVHGDVSWSGRLEDVAPGAWLIGWDAMRGYDYIPGMRDIYMPDIATGEGGTPASYRTLDYVRAETSRLAEQLAAMLGEPPTRKVYISCPSAALDVAREAMATARAMGWEVVGDWTEAVAAHGSQGVELSDLERERIVAMWWGAIGDANRVVAI